MSQENVEALRRGYEALNPFMRRGDREELLRAGEELVDPQVEFHWHDMRTMPAILELVRKLSNSPQRSRRNLVSPACPRNIQIVNTRISASTPLPRPARRAERP